MLADGQESGGPVQGVDGRHHMLCRGDAACALGSQRSQAGHRSICCTRRMQYVCSAQQAGRRVWLQGAGGRQPLQSRMQGATLGRGGRLLTSRCAGGQRGVSMQHSGMHPTQHLLSVETEQGWSDSWRVAARAGVSLRGVVLVWVCASVASHCGSVAGCRHHSLYLSAVGFHFDVRFVLMLVVGFYFISRPPTTAYMACWNVPVCQVGCTVCRMDADVGWDSSNKLGSLQVVVLVVTVLELLHRRNQPFLWSQLCCLLLGWSLTRHLRHSRCICTTAVATFGCFLWLPSICQLFCGAAEC